MASLYGNTCVLDALLIKPKRSQMSKGQAKQLDRVRDDEKRKADAKYVADDGRDVYRAFWNETLEEASQSKRLLNEWGEIQTEIKLGNQTLTEVRRAQLEKLLKSEDQMYREELNSMGLTIYKERL